MVSPHRTKRPWSGQVEKPPEDSIPEWDPKNPLCPGAVRANGIQNPRYESTFVFDNDFPALLETAPPPPSCDAGPDSDPLDEDLFRMGEAKGRCRVLCFHPKSNITLPLMSVDEIIPVIRTITQETVELGKKLAWVQVFENRGAIMGCSNPHPHCQIWASSYLPNEARLKDTNQRAYSAKHGGRPLLLDYVTRELVKKERLVVTNEDFVALVPFWAVWPFETMILPRRRNILRLEDLTPDEVRSLADCMRRLLIKYDNLFEVSFPYSMGFHGN